MHPVLKLVIQRLALGLLLLLAASVLIFVGTQILPGDVAQAILGQGATPEALANLRGFGLSDCFRKHNDEGGHYTWFDYRNASFERGHGMRIDHVYASAGLYERNLAVSHAREPRTWESPSDHLPVLAKFAGKS